MKAIETSRVDDQSVAHHSKNIWVVGASSGIGEALAKTLAQTQARVFVSARNAERLNEMAQEFAGKVIAVPMDIIDDWSVNAGIQKIKEHTPYLDQIIVNAGTCEYLDSHEVDIECVRRVMETNFFGVLNIVNQGLPLLREAAQNRRRPQLAFVSSSVTYQALPRAGAYGASKAAMRYFAESLKIDLQFENIDVRVVSPGFVETPLTDKNDFPMPFIISADEAAEKILKGLESKRFDIAFPWRFTASLKLLSYLPDCLKFKLLGKTSRHAV